MGRAVMDGLINVLKPPGMTSHDVVGYIRRLAGIKKVGHTGTLDPGAAGVLLVCCGRATRLMEYLDHNKSYRAEITFGAVSSTGDSFGDITPTGIPGEFGRSLVEETLPFFTGRVSQVPPMTSAVRRQGKKLYELARQGMVVERRPREVAIHSLQLAGWYGDDTRPRALLDINCSAGTYIRVLCQDLGQRLGCGAYMSFLLRTAAGGYTIGGSSTLEELAALAGEGKLAGAAVAPEEMLSFLPAVAVSRGAVNSVCSGAALFPPGVEKSPGGIGDGELVILTGEGRLLAVARAEADEKGRIIFKPEKIVV